MYSELKIQIRGRFHRSRDGNGSDSHGIEFEYYLLPYFDSNSKTDTDIFEYEYKNGCLEFGYLLNSIQSAYI